MQPRNLLEHNTHKHDNEHDKNPDNSQVIGLKSGDLEALATASL
jgi:hypothetical protein